MYPSGPQTFISKNFLIKVFSGRFVQTVQQKPRTTAQTSDVSQSSFGGTIPITSLPSATQTLRGLPVRNPGEFCSLIFRGK